MHEKKTFAVAEVKSAESDNPAGEFEIVMSTDSVDRDGESIVKGAFDPLPESIPVHAFHDFHDPVGRAFPSYNERGQLVGRGFFANTPRAQEIRQLVADGVIGHTSVGFMAAERRSGDKAPEIVGAELLEVSFVSVPSNRDAAVLAVKGLDEQPTAGLKAPDLQHLHDLAVASGAKCAEAAVEATPAPETPAATAGKSPASEVVDRPAATRVEAFLLGLDD